MLWALPPSFFFLISSQIGCPVPASFIVIIACHFMRSVRYLTSRINSVKVSSLATFSSEKYSRVPVGNTKGLMRLLCFEPGQSVALHTHPKSDECFFVVEGKGKITIDREEQDAESGCIFQAPAGVTHGWKNGAHRLILLSTLIPTSAYDLADDATEQKFV